MKKGKLLIGVFLVLVGLGTLPSVYLIASGLMSGNYDNGVYFVSKLVIYVLISISSLMFGIKFLRSSQIFEGSGE